MSLRTLQARFERERFERDAWLKQIQRATPFQLPCDMAAESSSSSDSNSDDDDDNDQDEGDENQVDERGLVPHPRACSSLVMPFQHLQRSLPLPSIPPSQAAPAPLNQSNIEKQQEPRKIEDDGNVVMPGLETAHGVAVPSSAGVPLPPIPSSSAALSASFFSSPTHPAMDLMPVRLPPNLTSWLHALKCYHVSHMKPRRAIRRALDWIEQWEEQEKRHATTSDEKQDGNDDQIEDDDNEDSIPIDDTDTIPPPLPPAPVPASASDSPSTPLTPPLIHSLLTRYVSFLSTSLFDSASTRSLDALASASEQFVRDVGRRMVAGAAGGNVDKISSRKSGHKANAAAMARTKQEVDDVDDDDGDAADPPSPSSSPASISSIHASESQQLYSAQHRLHVFLKDVITKRMQQRQQEKERKRKRVDQEREQQEERKRREQQSATSTSSLTQTKMEVDVDSTEKRTRHNEEGQITAKTSTDLPSPPALPSSTPSFPSTSLSSSSASSIPEPPSLPSLPTR